MGSCADGRCGPVPDGQAECPTPQSAADSIVFCKYPSQLIAAPAGGEQLGRKQGILEQRLDGAPAHRERFGQRAFLIHRGKPREARLEIAAGFVDYSGGSSHSEERFSKFRVRTPMPEFAPGPAYFFLEIKLSEYLFQ